MTHASLPPPPAAPEAARGLGALLGTEREHAELGTYQGRRLRARVERQRLRLALGRGRQLRLDLGRARATALEVWEGERHYELSIATPTDPWLRALGRTLGWWPASAALLLLLGRLRPRRRQYAEE